jgi:transglutaminase-like putative cysteine protease
MRFCQFFFLLAFGTGTFAQDLDFEYGAVTIPELTLKRYDMDTSASAVILNEYGRAQFSNHPPYNLNFEHHIRLKILKAAALERGNVSLVLRNFNSQQTESLVEVAASSFNFDEEGIKQTILQKEHVFTERQKDYQVIKLAVPNVRVGSVIELRYVMETPDYFNFKRWDFQEDIPKARSLYVARIPANYVYKVSLKGGIPLSRNETKEVSDCFMPVEGNKSGCVELIFEMEKIPAFVEEGYMTSAKNYRSSLNFELSEIRHFNGGVSRITKEWRDVEDELRLHPSFGQQLKRARDLMSDSVLVAASSRPDTLEKAKALFEAVKNRLAWDGTTDKYVRNGVKETWHQRKGNSADINLLLIAVLRQAGIRADPVILSTRENGLVTELYPVLSEFNYVIGRITVKGQEYLLDATDRNLPFGMIPYKCLNGRGRRIGEKPVGGWVEIRPRIKFREQTFVSLNVSDIGVAEGEATYTQAGYDAWEARDHIKSFPSVDEYCSAMSSVWRDLHIHAHNVINLDSIEKPLIESIRFSLWEVEMSNATFEFNPFLFSRWETNPFLASERFSPVDFAAPLDERVTLKLEYPTHLEIVRMPASQVLFLPDKAGKYVVEIQQQEGSLVFSAWLTIDQTVFTTNQYAGLREFFSRVVESQRTDLVFRRK